MSPTARSRTEGATRDAMSTLDGAANAPTTTLGPHWQVQRRSGCQLRRSLVLSLLLAGCGTKPAARPAVRPPSATAPEARRQPATSGYDPAWGDECAMGDGPLPFGRARTIELVTCADDPPPPDDTARPRQYTAYLVVRHKGEIASTLTLGPFVVWEEGHEWKLVGAVESAAGAGAALALYNDSGVGPGSSLYRLHAYALSDEQLTELYTVSASGIEVKVSKDRRLVQIELCSGCGDDGERTTEMVELRFDGSRMLERRMP
jgi:hypothetical protein